MELPPDLVIKEMGHTHAATARKNRFSISALRSLMPPWGKRGGGGCLVIYAHKHPENSSLLVSVKQNIHYRHIYLVERFKFGRLT